MELVKFEDLKEGESYIVISPMEKAKASKMPKAGKRGFVLGNSELEMNFEFEREQLITIKKIELPFFVIQSRHSREFVRLQPEWSYLKPSADFVKSLKSRCADDDY
jgi:hypothetical protein